MASDLSARDHIRALYEACEHRHARPPRVIAVARTVFQQYDRELVQRPHPCAVRALYFRRARVVPADQSEPTH